jgi:ATPase subunit of ABC transporter with duplicated ATPase domains
VSSIHLSNLSFSYSSAAPLFAGVDADLGPGWTGIVGPNGAGKTTLLGLMSGSLTPGAGSAAVVPGESLVVLCPQRVDRADERIERLAASWDGAASRLRSLLGLDPADLGRWPTLSPGERKRWQVGAALAARPDVLLADEPTNHLDGEARDLLADALAEFPGCGVIVSHDRALLDRITVHTLRIAGHRVESWSGNYSAAREAWTAFEAERRADYERARAEQRRAVRHLRRASQSRATAEASMIRERRTASVKDHDARGTMRTGRLAAAERVLGRQVEVARRAVDRADARVGSFEMQRERGGAVGLAGEPAPKEWIVRLDLEELCAGTHRLAGPVHLGVRRGDRIRVTGRNGAGKTTLLGALAGAATVAPDRVLRLEQELTEAEARTRLAAVRALPPERRGRLLAIVAALGVAPERLLSSDEPSPGEARKITMAYGLATDAWLVLLDEPTNHLDLPSIEALEGAFAEFPGALVVVTHDDAFAGRLARTEWRIEDGEVRVVR